MKPTVIVVGIVVFWFLIAQNVLREVMGYTLCVLLTLIVALMFAQNITSKSTFYDLFKSLRPFWPMWIGPVVLGGVSLLFSVWIGYLGQRDTPMAFYYFWNVVAWGGLLWGLGCIFYPSTIGERSVMAIGKWIRLGGCWMLFNKEKRNLPANSFAALWVILLFITGLYGLPLPQIIDSEEWMHTAAVAMGILEPDSLPNRYVRSWLLVELTAVLFPVMIAGLVYSRLDGIRALAKKEAKGVEGGPNVPAAVAPAAAEAVAAKPEAGLRQQTMWEWLGDDFIAELLFKIGNWISKTWSKKIKL